MEKGTAVKEKYGKGIFDIDFNPWYVTKTGRFYTGNQRLKKAGDSL
jgi:hypothetical protein